MLLLKAGVVLPQISKNMILNVDIIDWASIKEFVNHDSTDATKSTKQIQKELAMSLLFISENIKKNKLQYDTKDVQQIYDIFRNHIQRSYQVGIAYVNNIFNSKGFIDSEDIKVIKYLSEYYTQIFINSIDKILLDPKLLLDIGRYITDINEDRLEKSKIFNHVAHSVSATFQALQVATVLKTLVLYRDNSTLNTHSVAAQIPTLEFKWISSLKERVCPTCSEMSQMMWPINSWDSIPLIPHATHPHCRCRVILTSTITQTDS